ncbi:MAG: two-component system glycerol uptake and utilization response regulator [Marinobacter maritimus]|jgi:two-component system glycerol uptake and utilization response regulator|uniref:GGDEF domain-containing protein n=1 Tax=Marinobacter maritimus TaxID=277961 RepID=UPI000BD742A7|nr:diguanylate cyclase [Marinobacter maritimus]MBL1273270.1 diguanylate cyclase [Oceanospirillales bacterium]
MDINSAPTVLIVEDEPVGIASLAGILGGACELIISQSLAEARRLLSDEIDIVLLDLYLPDGSGLNFLNELRASELYAYVPVVCISASDQIQDIEEAFRHGATDYVLKPFNKTILSAKVSTFIDLKRKTDMLAEAALTDPLTGIGNRRLFNQQLDLEWRRARRQDNSIGLILVDLDHFKQINDRYGHAQGDLCLQKLATIMNSSFARAGEVIARLGGDEFVALIPGANLHSTITAANNFAKAVHTELHNCLQFAKTYTPFTLSIGCTAFQPSSLSSTAELIEAADKSLYEAKEDGGRNCVRPLL